MDARIPFHIPQGLGVPSFYLLISFPLDLRAPYQHRLPPTVASTTNSYIDSPRLSSPISFVDSPQLSSAL